MGKLTDAETAEIARLAASGVAQKDLAKRFGVSPSHVSRLLSGQRRGRAEAESSAVAAALDSFLVELAPAGVGLVHAETARALAAKVDACLSSSSVAAAAALPRLVAQLQELMGVLSGQTAEESAAAAVARLLRPLAA